MLDIATIGLKVDANGAIQSVNTLDSKLSGLTGTSQKLMSAFGALGVTLSAGYLATKFVQNTIEAQNAYAQLEARVKSTGMAAGFTVGQLDDMSVAMQRQTTYSDEAVKGAQAMLLTFGKIKGDQFVGATEAVTNLATALGGDLQGAAIQVGKALQDPAQGLLALRRSGVSFSEAQQDVIKALFETGREAEAQRMILAELHKEFGGAAEAARNTFGGAIKALNESMGDLFELTKDDTSGIVALINATNESVRELNEMKGAIKGVAYTLGAAGLAGGLAMGVTAMSAMVGGIATLSEAFLAAQLAAHAFWIAVTGPVGLAIAGLTGVALVMAKILGDDAKANAAMDAREKADQYMAQMALKRHREKIDAEKELDLVRQAASLKADAAAKKQATADAAEIAGLEAKARRALVVAAAQDEVNKKLGREATLRGMNAGYVRPAAGPGFLPMPAQGSEMSHQLSKGTSWVQGEVKEFDQAAAAKLAIEAAMQAKRNALAEASAKTREQIEQNFLRGMQESFAATFLDIFRKGVKSFDDLFTRFGDLLKQAAAQAASAGLMRALTGTKGEDGKMSGGLLSGAVNMISGPVGWIAGAVAGIAGLINSHHKAAEAAKRQAEENERLAIAAQKVAEADRKRIEFEQKVAEGAHKWSMERAADDLQVRQFELDGKKDEAEVQRKINENLAQYQKAVADGWDFTLLGWLSNVQANELAQLKATQAANAAAAAEKALADARAKAAEQASALQDLEVEFLRAKGQTAEADQREFDLAQQRRLEDAQKNQTEDYVKKLLELQALERANRAAAAAAGAATGAGAGAEASTASNIFAGADTVTTNFSSKVSAEVGDRMLDNLVSMRIILRAIEVNTRNIGGRLNTSLGLSLADNRSLSGSAVLS